MANKCMYTFIYINVHIYVNVHIQVCVFVCVYISHHHLKLKLYASCYGKMPLTPDCINYLSTMLLNILQISCLTLSNVFFPLAVSYMGPWAIWGRSSVFITILHSTVAIKIYIHWINELFNPEKFPDVNVQGILSFEQIF